MRRPMLMLLTAAAFAVGSAGAAFASAADANV